MSLSSFQIQAMHIWPRVTKRPGGLRGDGEFGILNKCGKHWQVWLYPTAEAAKEKLREWAENGCGSHCMMDHQKVRIHVDEAYLDRKFREQFEKTGC